MFFQRHSRFAPDLSTAILCFQRHSRIVPSIFKVTAPETFGNVLSSDWIPAFAGMTDAFAGMTGDSTGSPFQKTIAPARRGNLGDAVSFDQNASADWFIEALTHRAIEPLKIGLRVAFSIKQRSKESMATSQ
jgi:hypothetical protein